MRELLTIKATVDQILAMEQTKPPGQKKTMTSGKLVTVISVRQNAQPQNEILRSMGAWETSLNKRVGLSG